MRGVSKNGMKILWGNNPLHYAGYTEKAEDAAWEKTGLKEAVITGKAQIGGIETVLGVCDGRFMMASMGQAVGGKKLPVRLNGQKKNSFR